MAKITRTAVMRPRECVTCNVTFLSRTSKKKFCDACRLERDRDADRKIKAVIAASVGVRLIGSTDVCKNCGSDFVLLSGAMKHCSDCRESRLRRWKKHKAKTDFKFDITSRIRRGINSCLGVGQKAQRSWERLVGYDYVQLKTHLEKQFLPGMSWENRSLWHIDHIRPVASFTITSADCEDFKDCWTLNNLQPLWARDNLVKQDKILYLI